MLYEARFLFMPEKRMCLLSVNDYQRFHLQISRRSIFLSGHDPELIDLLFQVTTDGWKPKHTLGSQYFLSSHLQVNTWAAETNSNSATFAFSFTNIFIFFTSHFPSNTNTVFVVFMCIYVCLCLENQFWKQKWTHSILACSLIFAGGMLLAWKLCSYLS